MNCRILGKTGEKVSALGFGCMRLPVIGGDENHVDKEAATSLLHSAIERGVNYVDTAYSYHGGNSEKWLGEALRDGYREKVLLATKLPSWKIETKADFDKYLNEQLENLKTNRLDCYLVHALVKEYWENLTRLDVFSFLERAIGDGRIRYAGFSFHDELSLFKEIMDSFNWSFCLIQYNYMDEHTQAGREGLEYAASKGLGVAVMEPLHGGFLAKEPPAGIARIWSKAKVKRSPAEWALRWVWNHSEVSTVLSGMNSTEQLEENLAVASSALPNSLSEEELGLVDEVGDKYAERILVPCTECGYCLPCPQGVNIPKILSLYNQTSIFEDCAGSSWLYQNTLKENERASNCNECGECEEACPQKIKIIEELKASHNALTA